jgi:hypothetical protein
MKKKLIATIKLYEYALNKQRRFLAQANIKEKIGISTNALTIRAVLMNLVKEAHYF